MFERTVCKLMARVAGHDCGMDFVEAAREVSAMVYNDGVQWQHNLTKYAEEYRGPAGHALPVGRQTCYVDTKHPAFEYSLPIAGTQVCLMNFINHRLIFKRVTYSPPMFSADIHALGQQHLGINDYSHSGPRTVQ